MKPRRARELVDDIIEAVFVFVWTLTLCAILWMAWQDAGRVLWEAWISGDLRRWSDEHGSAPGLYQPTGWEI